MLSSGFLYWVAMSEKIKASSVPQMQVLAFVYWVATSMGSSCYQHVQVEEESCGCEWMEMEVPLINYL
jgi:hypothetical protein